MFQLNTAEFIFDEDKEIGMRFGDSAGTDFSTATGVVDLTPFPSGAALLTAEPMAQTGTNPVIFTELLETGAGELIVTFGDYRAVYTITFGSKTYIFEQIIKVIAKPIIGIYHNIAEWTRSRLQKSESELNDKQLEREIISVLDWLTATYPCIGEYPTDYPTDTADRRAIEEAVGLIVAARRYALQTNIATGDIKARTEGDTRYEFDVVSSSLTTGAEREKWLTEASKALYRHSCIKDSQTGNSAIGLFSVVNIPVRRATTIGDIFDEIVSIVD